MITLLALTVFASMDEAAIAGLTTAKDCSAEVRECGGLIFKVANGFTVSPIRAGTGKFGGLDLWPLLSSMRADAELVADFHVHTCMPGNALFSQFFSKADTIVNRHFNEVGYMFSWCDHMVHRWDPSQDDEDDEEVDFKPHADGTVHPPLYLTIGHIVGWIP